MDPNPLISSALVDALGRVGAANPDVLVEARLQAHWAAQVLAAVGFSYLSPADDYSHTSLQWDREAGLLTTGALPDSDRRAGLEVRSLTLQLGEERLPLPGKMLADGYAWMRSAVERQTGQIPRQDLKTPPHDLPHHPVEDGAVFGADGAALAEVEAWFAAGSALTCAVAEQAEGAGSARLWPHHFDVASLITVAGSGEDARTVGVGLSPGDGGKPQPYWYVTPWPSPKTDGLPELEGGGRWHTEGWTGAVLDAADLVTHDDADARARALAAFVSSAVAAGRTLAGQPG